jgi:tRNA pseudouridine38-40 synthase
LQNIKIVFAYDGSCFNGSATQPLKNTVEDTLKDALKRLNITNDLVLSGRTDKNVHATGQVASIKIPTFWNNLDKLKDSLSSQLPNSIQIKNIKKVNDDFHARFSSTKRAYRYIISAKELTPFNQKYYHYHNRQIDETKINEAISYFIGSHNFKNFSKKGSDPKTTIREIYDIKFYKYKDLYIFKFTANSYLRSQIRMMVDFLLKISSDKLTINDLKLQLSNQKLISWTLAPANGLYLAMVK